jgi:pimeloyl-ACP methyl ester carboxylesterase
MADHTYVLVHGAWQGAWAWDEVAAGLRAIGAKDVIAVELPAHGADETPVADATLDAYVAAVERAIDAAHAPVVLIGHSLGGVVITQAAERRPKRIAKLVYVAAFVPRDGQSLQTLSATDAGSHLNRVLQINPTAGIAAIPTSQLQDVFCNDGSPAVLARLSSRYRDEPLVPLATPVHVTLAGWGAVAKYYVYTRRDHTISYSLQQTMTADLTLMATASLDTGHSPFLSASDQLIAALARF